LYHGTCSTRAQASQAQGGRSTPKEKYSSRIIKAGALLADTTLLLSTWEPTASPPASLAAIRTQNLFGKTSLSRVEDILAIFRQRYLRDARAAAALSEMVKAHVRMETVRPLLYFYSCRSDLLLHDVVTQLVEPKWAAGDLDIDVPEVERVLAGWVEEGMTVGRWSPPTIRRIAHGLLATLRDFGVLEGAVNKRIRHPYLPPEAFGFIALTLQLTGNGGRSLVESPEWRLFFLGRDEVERLFVEAQQLRLLRYQAAGTVVRIDFAAKSLEEYARVLTHRTD
jgi:hypothetical protein